MIKKVIWALVIILIAGLLQSTLLSRLTFLYAIPDLTLVILVYTAYVNGTMCGQVTGFFSGLLLDFISVAPLGYNALTRTLIGALTGFMKGTFFLDVIFLPMFLCAGATIAKALSRNLLSILLAGVVPAYNFFLPYFWVELGLNIVIAPLLFAFLKLFKSLLVGKREDSWK
jgi:rod shape-determining protein MreD